MDRALELEDIMLVPSEFNHGFRPKEFQFGVPDLLDKSVSLPIFTSPMDSVVGIGNWKIWNDNGIRPIIPRTEELNTRLEACCHIFAAFSIKEVKDNFLMNDRRNISSQFRICIDPGNGHDLELFNVGKDLKSRYGDQIILMGGNLGNHKAYIDYCKAGFDYVRVGFSNGSTVDEEKFGFYYPMASLLLEVKAAKITAAGLKQTKVIADGGISNQVDILKCLALGADYVMIGREFARLIEANGPIFEKKVNKQTGDTYNALSEENINEILKNYSLKEANLKRLYYGNTNQKAQALRDGYDDVHDWMENVKASKIKPIDSTCDWITVSDSLKNWLDKMYECFNYAFTITDSVNWEIFKKNVNIVRRS